MCTRLKHALCFITALISVQEDGAVEVLQSELRRMDYLIKKVFNEYNTFTHIEQANQDVWQDDRHRQTKRQTHSNFHVFKFRIYLISYTRLFTKLRKSLRNFILRYIYYNENFQIYGMYMY